MFCFYVKIIKQKINSPFFHGPERELKDRPMGWLLWMVLKKGKGGIQVFSFFCHHCGFGFFVIIFAFL